MAVSGAFEGGGGCSDERACDDAADADVLLVEELACGLAEVEEALEAEGFLVGGDLEDAVGAGVEDGIAGGGVFFAELFEDFGAGGGEVSDEGDAGAVFEFADEGGGEGLEEGEGFFGDAAHEFPVAGGGVLAGGVGGEPGGLGGGVVGGRGERGGDDLVEAEGGEVGEIEAGDAFEEVAEGVCAVVAEVGGVRGVAAADGVEDDDEGAFGWLRGWHGGCLGKEFQGDLNH